MRDLLLLTSAMLAPEWISSLTTAHAQAPIVLRDVTHRSGLTFKHTDGSSGKRYLVEAVSAGLALFDYNGDGRVDIYLLNGAPLKGTKADVAPRNALYRNVGNFRFVDVTDQAGVGDTGFALGVAVGDYDNDGDADLYVNNYGPNVLYRNSGDGSFSDVTSVAGVESGKKVGAGACFLDMEGDGDLDLFVANYLKFTYETHITRSVGGFLMYAEPKDYPAEPDALYRNNGDGTFADVSALSGVGAHAGTGMGTVCADYDDDGDTDIFVANDGMGNFLYKNDGTGKFEEIGMITGFGYDVVGTEQASMGVDCGDYDGDGRLDFHVTSYAGEYATLYRNLEGGVFEDVSLMTGAAGGTIPCVTWGNGFVDFDNDGDLDIFVAAGHLGDNVERYDDTVEYNAANILLANTGGGRFVNVSDKAGDGLSLKRSSRGAVFDDLDNDGAIDVVILNSRREPTVLRNETKNGNHWVKFRLRGRSSNRDGVGARVKVTAGKLTQIAEVHSGRGYQSHYGTRLHFGLGSHDQVDRVEVRWIGGGVDSFKDIKVDQVVTLTQGGSKTGGR